MRAVVISCPHTGTRWTLKLLQGWGLGLGIEQQAAHVRLTPRKLRGDEYDALGWEELMESATHVVVPLRERALADASRDRRGQPRSTDEEWATMLSLGERANVHYLTIPPTEADVQALADFLGVEVGPVDWTPEGDDPKELPGRLGREAAV